MPNALLLIHPYKDHGTWVFDDPRHGLVREPFVLGVTEMLDHLTRDIPAAENGFTLLFSANDFPGARPYHLLRPESGGNWYEDRTTNMQGWLCPALFHYFDQAPPILYAKAQPQGK